MTAMQQLVDIGMYRLVEIVFFLVFFVCLRDAWRRGKWGDIPPRLQRNPDENAPPPPGQRREEDNERNWYIQPQDEWERMPIDGDPTKRRPGYMWVCIMIAAMAFTFTFEYALTHRRAPASDGNPEGPPGSFSIYSYQEPALFSLGGIKAAIGSDEISTASGWAADGACHAPDIPVGKNSCQKAGSAVPIWIPCGWALIMYLVMRTSDKLAITWYKRPILDGLMALVIDFALDPVASWNHWWLWDFEKMKRIAAAAGIEVEPTIFFKVPATNYMAWVVIVASFSFFVRLFQHWRSGHFKTGLHRIPSKLFGKLPNNFFGDLIGPLLASAPAVVLVILYTNHARWLMTRREWFTDGALLCSVVWAILIVWVYLDAPKARRDHAHDHVLMFSPMVLYLAVLLALYTTRVPAGNSEGFAEGIMIYEAMPELVIIVPLASILGAFVFTFPYSKPGPESWW